MGWLSRWFGGDEDKAAPAPAPAPPPLLAKPKATGPTQSTPAGPNPFAKSATNPLGSTWNASTAGAGAPASRSQYQPSMPPAKPTAPPQQDFSAVWNATPISSSAPPTASPDTQTPTDAPQVVAPPSVLEMLNAAGWTTPTPNSVVRTPDQILTPGERALKDYQYQVSDQEWQLIQNQYNTPEAKAAGFLPPESAPGQGTVPLMRAENFSSAPMTWEQYDALSADQKAAVDYNTLLVEAREKDLNGPVSMTDEERRVYDENVERIFGKTGGSETLAPATVDLLSKIDMQAMGQDLDDYLSLDRAITDDELKNFKFSDKDIETLKTLTASPAGGGAGTYAPGAGKAPSNTSAYPYGSPSTGTAGATGTTNYAEVRSAENLAAVDTLAIQNARTLIETAMRDANNAIWSFNDATSGRPAAEFTSGEIPLGYGTGANRTDNDQLQVDSWLQSAWTYMSDPTNTDMSPLWAEINEGAAGAPTKQQFLDYVDQRTRRERQYGVPEGMGGGRNSDLVRDLIGLQ